MHFNLTTKAGLKLYRCLTNFRKAPQLKGNIKAILLLN